MNLGEPLRMKRRVFSIFEFAFYCTFNVFNGFINFRQCPVSINQLRRCFFTNATHARNIVRRITAQSFEVHDLRWKYAHFVLHFLNPKLLRRRCSFTKGCTHVQNFGEFMFID